MSPRRFARWTIAATVGAVLLSSGRPLRANTVTVTPSATPQKAAVPVPVVTTDNFLRLKAEVVGSGGIVLASFDLQGLDFAWQQWENVGTGPETYNTKITPDAQASLIAALAKTAFPSLHGRYDDPGKGDVNYRAITLYLRGTGLRRQRFLVRVADGFAPPGYNEAKSAINAWLHSVVPAASYTHWFF